METQIENPANQLLPYDCNQTLTIIAGKECYPDVRYFLGRHNTVLIQEDTNNVSKKTRDENIIDDGSFLISERESFENLKEFYLQSYEGKYIALLNQKVLDVDTDISELATRVFEKYGYNPAIFMPYVVREEPRHKLSPKIKRFVKDA